MNERVYTSLMSTWNARCMHTVQCNSSTKENVCYVAHKYKRL